MNRQVTKKLVDTKWISIEGYWHNVIRDKKVCDGSLVFHGVVGYNEDIDSAKICADCFNKLDVAKIGDKDDDLKFNIKIFGNVRYLEILSMLAEGDKRQYEFKHLISNQNKVHMDWEFKKLMYNKLIDKYGFYYTLTERGKLANKIGKVIMAFREMNDDKVSEVIRQLGGVIDGEL